MKIRDFNKRMWEVVLERHFLCSDIEITSFRFTSDGCVCGDFTAFSHLIDGVERNYTFFCDGCSINYYPSCEDL